MGALLLVIVPVLYSFQTLFCKLFSDRYSGRKDLATPVFCVFEGIFITIFTWVNNGFVFDPSWGTILIGLLNAVALLGYNTCLIKASALGSYAFVNVIQLFGGLLLPSLYSVIVLGDSIGILQIAGIGVMLLACVAMNIEGIQLKGTPLIYYVMCLLLFVCNGMYSVLLKVQDAFSADQSNEMVMITFGVMGVIAALQLKRKEKGHTLAAFKLDRHSIIPLLLCLFSAATAINLLVVVLNQMKATVVYTVNNGGVLVLSWLYSIVIFKEKITLSSVIGV
ncbi:MAG: hypothetical protein IJ315_03420, partial [Firmicutes bacterium]|nr:hypothetical protein [Bacillota bacterium]